LPRIDAHQHFWKYDPAALAWIDDSMGAIARDFLPGDLQPILAENGVEGCVAVQAQVSVEETEWLLDLADQNPWIRGVVGWVDLCSDRVFDRLERFRNRVKLCGVRHPVQSEPDDRYLLRREFMNGIAALGYFGLTYDLLIVPRQLRAAVELAARFPTQRFVLDHMAKPEVRAHKLEPWATLVRELGKNPNVHCKLSGLVTEADWSQWKPEDFTPYLDVVFDAFGVDRLMAGSDWPVCTLAGDYRRVMGILEPIAALLPAKSRDALLGANAQRFYGL
jgi:L-fuconolactonase